MDKNVGSVDIEELKRAREELNREMGIENDPNMYSNYDPTVKREDPVFRNSADEETSNETIEPEASKSAEPDYSSEEVSAESQDFVNDSIETQIESSDEYSSSDSSNEITLDIEENENGEISELDNPDSPQSETAGESELDANNAAKEDILKVILGDDYMNGLETEGLNFEEDTQESSSTPAEESEPTETRDLENAETANAERPSEAESQSSNNYAYNTILKSSNDENAGMSVNLPNIDDIKQQVKNFDVYDNFAAFEVHYTPPVEEVKIDEDDGISSEEEDMEMIRNILYGEDVSGESDEEEESADISAEPEISEESSEDNSQTEETQTSDIAKTSEVNETQSEEQVRNEPQALTETAQEKPQITDTTSDTSSENISNEMPSTADETLAINEEKSDDIEFSFEISENNDGDADINEVESETTSETVAEEPSQTAEESATEEAPAPVEEAISEETIAPAEETLIQATAPSIENETPEQNLAETNSKFDKIDDYTFIDAIVEDEFKNSNKLDILLGKNEDGKLEFCTLEKGYNFAVFTKENSDSFSNFLSTIMLSLMLKNNNEEVKFLVLDTESESKLENLSKNSFVLSENVVTDKDEILSKFVEISADLEERYKKLAKLKVKSIENYNDAVSGTNTPVMPYSIIVLANYQKLKKFSNEKEINAKLHSLLKLGRLVGIYVIINSCEPILMKEINYNLPSRITFKTDPDAGKSNYVGTEDAKYLEGEDDVLYSKIDKDPVHLKIAKISKSELKLLLQNIEN